MRHFTPGIRAMAEILSDGDFHNGTEIGQQLGVSRTTVAKYAQKLNGIGLRVNAVKGRGYSITRPIELLDPELIRSKAGNDIEVFDVIDSTNKYMLSRINSYQNGACILAETQIKGVGRANSAWISPFASQAIISMYWSFPSIPTGLSLTIGLAAAKVLESHGVKSIGLKWPNDIMVSGKKLAGILIEGTSGADGSFKAVIGAGINLLSSPLIDESSFEASSADRHSDIPISRNDIVCDLIASFRKTLGEFSGEFSAFRDEWNSKDVYSGKEVTLSDKHSGVIIATGIERGIGNLGEIIIEDANGVKTYHAGHLTLAKQHCLACLFNQK